MECQRAGKGTILKVASLLYIGSLINWTSQHPMLKSIVSVKTSSSDNAITQLERSFVVS